MRRRTCRTIIAPLWHVTMVALLLTSCSSAPAPTVAPLVEDPNDNEVGCWFSLRPNDYSFVFTENADRSAVWINLDGRDTPLEFISEEGGEVGGLNRTWRYSAPTTLVTLAVTEKGPGCEECTWFVFDGFMLIERGGRRTAIPVYGGCGD